MRYPIFVGDERNGPPLGFIELLEEIPEHVITESAILPRLVKRSGDRSYKVEDFHLIPRTQVDTRARD
jgi:hypothetical protein